jgi:hypothetical protein
MQRLSRPPPIQKLGAENHMLQLNIQCSWWWAYAPKTCRAKNTSIKLPFWIPHYLNRKLGLKLVRSRILSRTLNYYFWNSCRLFTPALCPRRRRRRHLRQCADTTTLNFYSSFVALSSPTTLSPFPYSPWIQSMPHCLIKVRIESIIRCKWKFKK